MRLWDRIEQFFKHNQLRFLDKLLGVRERAPKDVDRNSIKKILIVRQHDQLGDFLLSTPVFKALRQQFPHAYIAVVARKYTAALMRHDQYLDDVLIFYENGRDWNLKRIAEFIKLLRQRYDLAVVLNTVSHSLTSDLIARFSGARTILGTDHLKFKGTERNFFYHVAAPHAGTVRNQSQRNLDIVEYIGVSPVEPFEHMTLTPEETGWARQMLMAEGWDGEQRIIAIHPGAGKLGNRWPVEYFARAARELAAHFQARLLVTWGKDEADLGKTLVDLLPGNILAIVQKDIRKFAAMISPSFLFLCNDTGVMHVAAAIGVPLVVVFGPTNPDEWKPFGKKFVALKSSDGNCSSVEPEEIINAAKSLFV